MARQASLSQQEWQKIDSVLLDMDGTLLDLAFDNHFWLEHIPNLYALQKKLPLQVARNDLNQLYQQYQGTLNWYCTDFWSEQLELDIISIKRTLTEQIKIRPGTLEFLELCRTNGKQLVLLTNAHPDTLQVKLQKVDIASYFDLLISSHQTEQPKESNKFWRAIETSYKIDYKRSLFVDDSQDILDAAKTAGVSQLRTICQPALNQGKRDNLRFASVNRLIDLWPDELQKLHKATLSDV